jgi:hypothetical protein
MTGRFAAKTNVSPEKSKAEIERTLQRYGCAGFMYGYEGNEAMIAFRAHDKTVKFVLPMPEYNDDQFTKTPTGLRRSQSSQEQAFDQAVRQRWRALALAIKAKLEAVEVGIVSFEDEFLAHFVLPGGQTVGERLAGDLAQLETGRPLLEAGSR